MKIRDAKECKYDLVSLGECMLRLSPPQHGRIEFAPLPKTISGKIRRIELRQAEAARRATGERSVYEFFEEDFLDV